MFLVNSRFRTGSGANKLVKVIVVPVDRAQGVRFCMTPRWSSSRRVPQVADEWRVVTTMSDRAHNELSASPRKPKVVTSRRSVNLRSFDV